MKKFMEEQRTKFGEFEVIEWVDEDKIQSLRDKIDVDAPLDVHWQWEYGSEMEELRNLYEKGKVNQWNAEHQLEWDTPVSKDEWVLRQDSSMLAQMVAMMGGDEATQKAAAFDELAFTLSQLLHGEQAALQLCGQLTNACELMDEKWYAASQVIDEARHIEAISKFLSRKMGTIYPIGATLKTLLDELLQAPDAKTKTLGMQCLFEGTAVGVFDMLRNSSENDLLTDMIRRVEQDEARHAAFGVLTMRRVVQRAEKEEMDQMEDWAFGILEALNANQNLDMLRILGPKYGIEGRNVVMAGLSMPMWADFNSLMYMHTVIPNLKGLGLLTERTEEGWRKHGMMTDRRKTLPELREEAAAQAAN
jgi:hypothetical protein